MTDIYGILIPELQNDPLSRGYAAMIDEERLASLRAVNRTRTQSIPIGTFSNWLTGSLIRYKLEAAEASPQTAGIVVNPSPPVTLGQVIKTVWGVERNPHVSEVDVQTAGTLVAMLLFAEVVTTEENAAFQQLFQVPVSRETELGLSGLELGHLQSARELING